MLLKGWTGDDMFPVVEGVGWGLEAGCRDPWGCVDGVCDWSTDSGRNDNVNFNYNKLLNLKRKSRNYLPREKTVNLPGECPADPSGEVFGLRSTIAEAASSASGRGC